MRGIISPVGCQTFYEGFKYNIFTKPEQFKDMTCQVYERRLFEAHIYFFTTCVWTPYSAVGLKCGPLCVVVIQLNKPA